MDSPLIAAALCGYESLRRHLPSRSDLQEDLSQVPWPSKWGPTCEPDCARVHLAMSIPAVLWKDVWLEWDIIVVVGDVIRHDNRVMLVFQLVSDVAAHIAMT
jgi:hypothetical protein